MAQSSQSATAISTVICTSLAVALAAAVIGLAYLYRRLRRAERQRAIIESVSDRVRDGIAVVGPDGAASVTNRPWREMLGEEGEDVADALMRVVAPDPEAHDAVSAVLDAAAKSRTAEREIAFEDSEGQERVWRVTAEPVPVGDDHTLVRIEDVGESRRHRDALSAAGRALERIIGNGPLGLVRTDRDGRIISVNQAVAGWLGGTPEEVADGAARFQDVGHRAGSGANDPEGGEQLLTGRDGREVRTTVLALPDTLGPGEGGHSYLVHNLDATAQGTTELGGDAWIDKLYGDVPFGIVLLDESGTVADCNRAFLDMAGTERNEAVGRPFAARIADDDRPEVEAWIAGGDDHRSIEARLGPEGKTVVSIFPGRREEGAGTIVHMVDLTERKNLEEQVFQSQKMELVGQLAGGVAHDFNNLLTAMIGFCDLLLQRHSPKDQSFADINQIKQNANRAANLVRQLLAFSRQQTLQPRIVNLTDVLAELTHLLRRLIGANIELNIQHARDLGKVKADQGQLEQVVINLAVNARDAMADGGKLTIRTRGVDAGDAEIARRRDLPDGDYVVLEVQDSGCGIPKEHLDKIFEPFFTTKEVGQGTGLGLSTVYGIVKQTGGHIYVDSKPGSGATFTIYLPRYHGDEDRKSGRAGQDEPRKRRDLTGHGTVLLVEDEDAVRLFGARALRNKGYDVLEANNGEAALTVLNETDRDIDILISDVVMPGVDGPTLIREVRERHPEMKVIFISGYTEDSFRRRIDDGAVVHFLPKPFNLQQLALKVKEVMHG